MISKKLKTLLCAMAVILTSALMILAQGSTSSQNPTIKKINGERFVMISETQLARMEKLADQYDAMSNQLDNANAQIAKDKELREKDAEILASSKRETAAAFKLADSNEQRAIAAEKGAGQLKDAFDKLDAQLTKTTAEKDAALADNKKLKRENVVLKIVTVILAAVVGRAI